MALRLETVQTTSAELEELVRELDAALSGPYAADQHHALSLDELFAPNVSMFMARLDGKAVGCGGVAIYDQFAEVKRMYTRAEARGRGIARALLTCIEERARDAEASWLKLETGIYQSDAMALYERSGFSRCDAFGPYLEKPAHTIELSAFYEKRL